jgi:hypothetical protein
MRLNKTLFLYICLLACACSDKKTTTEESVIVNPPDTMAPVKTSTHQPDSSIKLKDDYNQLTTEELNHVDQTHMDMSYFPSNYAADMAYKRSPKLKIRLTYSRPQKKGRPVIFGNPDIVPMGVLWRLGANESTEIEFLTPVEIGGKRVKPGRYTVYAIPYPEKWTFIVNSDLFTWGDFNYDPKKDLVRTDIPVSTLTRIQETFLVYFQKTGQGCNMIMAWDNVQATLPIKMQE